MLTSPKRAALLAVVAALPGLGGCAAVMNMNQPLATNPMVVQTTDFDAAWDATVHAVDEYFEIDEENRLARRITTYPETAATLVEPWRGDSVGFQQRLEATLQTIRRFAIARVDPVPGGYSIRVEVYKELEFVDRPEKQTGGLAVFPQDFPVNRTREIVGPITPPLGWIPKGYDPALEQRILSQIRRELRRKGMATPPTAGLTPAPPPPG